MHPGGRQRVLRRLYCISLHNCRLFLRKFISLANNCRYAPKVAAGESYRWLSSIFLHHSYQHLFSNMIIFLALSLHLERMYGPFRVLALWLAGGA